MVEASPAIPATEPLPDRMGAPSPVLEAATEDTRTLAADAEAASGWDSSRARWIGAVALAFVTVLVAVALQQLVAELDYAAVLATLRATPNVQVLAAILATAVSFAALTIYDWSALRYQNARLPLPAVMLASFTSYAVGNTAGLGPLTGGALRLRLYSAMGLSPEQVAGVAAFTALAFALGVTAVGALAAIPAAGTLEAVTGLPDGIFIGLALAVVLPLTLATLLGGFRGVRIGIGRWRFRIPPARLILLQLLASAVDIVAAGLVLWFLLPPLPGIDFSVFIALYAAALVAGVISHVPGGLGVFEAIILAALHGQAPTEQIAAALVLYRVIYHLLPLALAACLLAGAEVMRSPAGPVVASVGRGAARVVPPVLAALSFVAGTILMANGVTPGAREQLMRLGDVVPLTLIEAGHFLASVAGVLLLVVARGLLSRLDGAWWTAVCITVIAGISILFRPLVVTELVVLVLLLVALLATRREFSRRSSMLTQPLTAGWWLAIVAVLVGLAWIFFFAYRGVEYRDDLWWQFEANAEAPRSLRAFLAMALLACGLGLWQLLRPAARPRGRVGAQPEQLEVARKILTAQDNPQAALVLLGDKKVLLGEDGAGFVMFGQRARSWVALGDPVGPKTQWGELIWSFVDIARSHGGRAVFYQATPEALPLLLDAGLRAYKLGEEGRVRLQSFSIQGGKGKALRYALSRAERDGLTLERLEAGAAVDAAMGDLTAISDAWMAPQKGREKRFSLGAFDPAYVRQQPVALVRLNGTPVAFASLLETGTGRECAVDLMRHTQEAPAITMEWLMLRLILDAKDRGADWFSLGMAPLAGLVDRPFAPLWHRVGRYVWRHGAAFYNFKGLRAFKDKFSPEWSPRYLAVSGGINPLLALVDVTALINGGLGGVVRR